MSALAVQGQAWAPFPRLGRRGCVSPPVKPIAVVLGTGSSSSSSSSSSSHIPGRTSFCQAPRFPRCVGAGLVAGAIAAISPDRPPTHRDRVRVQKQKDSRLPPEDSPMSSGALKRLRLKKKRAEAVENEEETLVFWEEQVTATIGPGGKSRDKQAERLPDPLPSLEPTEDMLAQAEQFRKTYRASQSQILDIDGTEMDIPTYTTFHEAVKELNFPVALQAALSRKEFVHLTPVQQCTLPLFLSGRDFLASAFTGSGKTAAYLLPILKSLQEMTQLTIGDTVAAHCKLRGEKSEKPMLGKVMGMQKGLAAIKFEDQSTGKTHNQLVPPDWVVSVTTTTPPTRRRFEGPARPMALVLVPTRELAEQVFREAESFLHYSHLRAAVLYQSEAERNGKILRQLAHGADILVATPGRLTVALLEGIVKLDQVKYMVLDEVDRMMELGFQEQLNEIVMVGEMPTWHGGRQTSFWSATIPESVRELIEAFLGEECVWVDCTAGFRNAVPRNVKHIVVDARPYHRVFRQFEPEDRVVVHGKRKGWVEMKSHNGRKIKVRFDHENGDTESSWYPKGRVDHVLTYSDAFKEDRLNLLVEVLECDPLKEASVMIFCRNRKTVEEVFKRLQEKFEKVVMIYGAASQSFRTRAVKALQRGEADILVTTDVCARGIDLPNVNYVINYEMPSAVDELVHRCGRTGRIGREGTAIHFLHGREPIFRNVRRLIRAAGHFVPKWCWRDKVLKRKWRWRGQRLPYPLQKGEKDLSDVHFSKLKAKRTEYRDNLMRVRAQWMLEMAEAEGADAGDSRFEEFDEEDFEDDIPGEETNQIDG